MARTISFEAAKAARAKDLPEYTTEFRPEDLGLDPDVVGKEPIAVKYRAFSRDEFNEILESVKDLKFPEYQDEKDIEIITRCLLKPKIPASAEGTKFLDSWLPGTVGNLSLHIQNASGYRQNYNIQRAADAIKNSEKATPTPSSTSK